jgi:CubicO group peptidase (beta-lactamase class C family)
MGTASILMKLSHYLLILILLITMPAHAQNKENVNDSLFTIVKNYINVQNGDALYGMLNDDFKAKFPKETFSSVLKSGLYPLGAIIQSSFIDIKDGVSSYKTECTNAMLQFKIGADKDGKIAHLQFLPYKEPAASKNYKVPSDNPMKTALDSQVDNIARAYINKVTTVGLSIGIVKDGETHFYGYGATAKDNGHIPAPDAIFEIGSITKTFTATLLAYYVKEHKVELSDPITKYLPDSVAANKNLQQITLQMLANHTSGLPRLPSNLILNATTMADPYKDYNKEQLFAYLKNCELTSIPGGKYSYSNLAAGLLGTILERVSRQTYEQMVTGVICNPLEMKNTMQHPDAQQKELLVKTHNDKGEPVLMWNMDALAGAGALRSSTRDMLLYAQANMKGKKGSLSKAMQLTHIVTYDKEMTIGLGWHMGKIKDDSYIWHNGGTGGSSSYMAFSPDKKIAVVVLSNSAENTDATGQDIFKALQ